MSCTFLEKVIGETKARVAQRKATADISDIRARAEAARARAKANTFRKALARADRTNIIAEIKRRSPSKGVINDAPDIAKTARQYEVGGAAAISVLTEGNYFGGSLNDLRAVRAAVGLPVLRKDFIIDEFQVYEAAEAGADAVLLIVVALSEDELGGLLGLVGRLYMDALVEVHTRGEMETAAKFGAEMIGVNNRDLHSLEVSLDVSRSLMRDRPDNVLMVAESGLTSATEIAELRSLGFDAFLIGETLMRSTDPAAALRHLSQGVAA
jgi:indole-3-glycerol phosphate synthase